VKLATLDVASSHQSIVWRNPAAVLRPHRVALGSGPTAAAVSDQPLSTILLEMLRADVALRKGALRQARPRSRRTQAARRRSKGRMAAARYWCAGVRRCDIQGTLRFQVAAYAAIEAAVSSWPPTTPPVERGRDPVLRRPRFPSKESQRAWCTPAAAPPPKHRLVAPCRRWAPASRAGSRLDSATRHWRGVLRRRGAVRMADSCHPAACVRARPGVAAVERRRSTPLKAFWWLFADCVRVRPLAAANEPTGAAVSRPTGKRSWISTKAGTGIREDTGSVDARSIQRNPVQRGHLQGPLFCFRLERFVKLSGSIPGASSSRLPQLAGLLAPRHGRLACCGATPGRSDRTHVNGSRTNTIPSHHTQSSQSNRCLPFCTPPFLLLLHTPSPVARLPPPPPRPPSARALLRDSHG